ncbi:UNVERIFIED_CONTAM: hypothetical protein GTU68_055345 [Idotea baltica]|nr:hypothetical protein [Idotea baltica]
MRLAVAGFAMMNVMLLSVAVWSGASDATRDMFHWISALIAVPVIGYSGQPFYRNAWRALSAGKLNMDVPISLAIILAGGMSVYETTQSGHHAYFDAALSLTFFLLIGRYLEHRTRAAARSAARELAALEVQNATLLDAKGPHEVRVDSLEIGDVILVPAGHRIAVDGVIKKGQTTLDRSFLTGESLPIPAGFSDVVTAGEINVAGPLEVQVTAVGEDTTLRKMAALVEIAEIARNRFSGLADRAAQIYAPAVHLLAFVAFVVWVWITGDARLALNIAIAVLIITCPCALGLAVPAVNTAASGRLFRRGVLIKSDTALERLAEVDTVVFDKTGTLTEGVARFDLSEWAQVDLSVLKALSQASTHPVSRSITQLMPNTLCAAAIDDLKEVPGMGVQGIWNGVEVRLGRANWVGADQGPAFRMGDSPAKTILIEETLRPGVQDAVSGFRELGLTLHLMTGDKDTYAADVAKALGIENVQANLMPDEKLGSIEDMARKGARILMIGDGLNDTAALASAHVSMAPASAMDAPRAVADFVVLTTDFTLLPDVVATARHAKSRIIENFAMAVVYNFVAVPVALLGFATPLIAALAMSSSSISVLVNALRVR